MFGQVENQIVFQNLLIHWQARFELVLPVGLELQPVDIKRFGFGKVKNAD